MQAALQQCVGSRSAELGEIPSASGLQPELCGALSLIPSCCMQAHSAPVTSLHASEYGMQLWSGAQDGSLHAYDMSCKPSQPVVKLHQVGLHATLHAFQHLQS